MTNVDAAAASVARMHARSWWIDVVASFKFGNQRRVGCGLKTNERTEQGMFSME
jgi:hypothetical protein